uniref:Uncharacterized protein n=1 Tax=Pseudomonas phage HRDY3 TaxID=3236930 RepID=A0AB39CEN5_9VIRU
MKKYELHDIVAYFEDRGRDIDRHQEMADAAEAAFKGLFNHACDFALGFDPYYTDRELANIGTEGQRGEPDQIRAAHFLFNEDGALREWLKNYLERMRFDNAPSLGSDLATLYFGVEMTRITDRRYTAVYAWK